jgi:4-diphosphocytidyl-2-C-methyl-D-erythritol kinase
MAAGLAGGSADAAAVMLALAKALAPGAALADIVAAGAEIGADVPFCMAAIAKREPSLGYADDAAAGASFICEGIGDVLSPAPPVREFGVLIKPAIEVSTPTVYAAWDEGDFAKPGGGQGNDLEPVAKGLFPEIGEIMKEVEALLRGAGGESESEPTDEAYGKSGAAPKRVFMTGSGPTIIALYDDRASATQGYGRLSAAYKNRADVGAVIAFCLTN